MFSSVRRGLHTSIGRRGGGCDVLKGGLRVQWSNGGNGGGTLILVEEIGLRRIASVMLSDVKITGSSVVVWFSMVTREERLL